MTLGALPGAEAFTAARAEASPPPIVPTQFAPLQPVQAQATPVGYLDDWRGTSAYSAYGPYPATPYAAVPVYYYPAAPPAPALPQPTPPRPSGYTPAVIEAPPEFYAPIPQLDDWHLSRIASTALPEWRNRQSRPAAPGVPPTIPSGKLDQLQLSAWALLRGRSSAGALASGGTLGGSQAGVRLTYNVTREIAASLRSSSPVGGSRGGEVAAGIRLTPFRSVPISLTAERRQAIGRYSTGRSALALFLEGGVYQQPLGWGLSVDGYAQAGVVGARGRDLFADGGFTIMRPLYGRFSVGLGAWGGYQPGIYRLDAGPRVSMRVRPNIRVDLDWRQRLAGAAEPGSGPAVTLAADF